MASSKLTQYCALSIFSLGACLMAGTAFADAIPASHIHLSSVQKVKDHWAKLEERISFNELSSQSLQALNAILDADTLIEQNHPKEAKTKLTFARQELQAALQAHLNLAKSVSYIETIHKTNPAITWLPHYSRANWAPVGGKFIAKTKLSSDENKALLKANNDLRAGKGDLAYQTIKPFQAKVQISVALAPLEPTMNMVEAALKALQNHDRKSARDHLHEALEHYVFIPQKDLNVNALVSSDSADKNEVIASR